MNHPTRRTFFKRTGLYTLVLPFVSFTKYLWRSKKADTNVVYFTNGLKITELQPHKAIIWTRLCASMNPLPIKHDRIDKGGTDYPVGFDEEMPVDQMDGAVPGTAGEVRLILYGSAEKITSDWYPARSENDFTVHIPVNELMPSTSYFLTLEGRKNIQSPVSRIQGQFSTPADKNKATSVLLSTSTCQYFWNYDDPERGYKTYDSMRRLNPDLFLQTGDYVYYDRPGPLADTVEKARHKWHAMNSWPSLRSFFQQTPVYMLKDDHDLLSDDAWRETKALGKLTYQDGLKIWRENVPLGDKIGSADLSLNTGKPYRTFRWGKDLQIWLAESREFRKQEEGLPRSERSIWGQEQKDWFQRTVNESEATFKLLISPMPIVGPDRDNKADNHSNKRFAVEGEWLREFIASQPSMYIINGDRHWQYVSTDIETGIWEFGSGPVSDAHAGGWNQEDVRPEHKFLRVKGGFLTVRVDRKNDQPYILFIHYDVDGNPVHSEQFEA